ncbi:hypothetical protein SCLCIDRAFT_1223430 [Scleroderma citrinum Foug A]|uniref:Uncharacterized protein n=1 Tax=Scleroderma citrinum Foug A TaxID=1036808 RepID=A0A0C3D8R1_9AGAM|nr:hypothetical protein SCLCIDRAFT_1223430 [Scleroderma citrinum Foug A]
MARIEIHSTLSCPSSISYQTRKRHFIDNRRSSMGLVIWSHPPLTPTLKRVHLPDLSRLMKMIIQYAQLL